MMGRLIRRVFRLEGVEMSEFSENNFTFSEDVSDRIITNDAETRHYTVFRGDGNDTLRRLSDDFGAYDTIVAGAGNDIIDAGGGFGNIIWTGAGADTVVRSSRFEHQTTIKDFTTGEDTLDISVLGVTSFDDLAPFFFTHSEGGQTDHAMARRR